MAVYVLSAFAGTIFAVAALVLFEAKKKNMQVWLPAYLKQVLRKRTKPFSGELINIVFCVVDHYEPMRDNADIATQRNRVDTWVREYPKLAAKHCDYAGKHPPHTFFYPEEEYREEHLDKLAKLCRDGFGEVEIHLHHDNDTADGLRTKLESFKVRLSRHGLLERDEKGVLTYGFIHGNWALNNSRRDGRDCGVNNELTVLRETGCFADFTLPSAPSETQTRKINSLYYAADVPGKPKSHDTGADVEAGKDPVGDLMIVQGPLTLNWRSRKWGLLPRIEDGKIDRTNPPGGYRADLWIQQHIHVKGRPDWIFVKAYTHGAQEENFPTLLGKPMDELFDYLETRYNDGKRYRLHYVTARGMYRLIKDLENGKLQ